MSRGSAEELLEAAREIALRSGEILSGWFRRLEPGQVRLKARRNPVTAADLESEELLVAEIRRRFPGHAILAEEGGRTGGQGELRWILDPLDGTVNFSHGLPVFCVALAVQRGAEVILSVVHAPLLGETYTALRGGGAWLNGRRLRVSRQADLREALLATGFAYGRNEAADDNVAHFADLVNRCRDIRRMGSASLDFAALAAGRFDAYWELDLAPWDVAPGWLLVEEAGGRVTDLHGGARILERGSLLASNGSLHDEILTILNAPG